MYKTYLKVSAKQVNYDKGMERLKKPIIMTDY